MADETTIQDPPVQQPPAYIDKVYSALHDNLTGFTKTPDEFKSAMQDPAYAAKAYSALKDNLTGFNKSQDEFFQATGIPKKAGGAGSPLTSNPLGNGLNPFQSSQAPILYKPETPSPSTPVPQAYWKSLNQQEQDALSRGTQQAQQQGAISATPTQQQGDYQYAQTLPGKIQNGLTYLAQKATKGGLQVAKGAAYLASMQQNATKGQFSGDDPLAEAALNKADKATDFLPKTSQNEVEKSKIMSNLGGLAEFLPSAAAAEGTGGATLYLQGMGQGKEIMDKVGKDVNPVVKTAFILGTGALNGFLMGDIGHGIYNSLGTSMKNDVVKSIAMDAIKEAAGKDLTAQEFGNLLKQGAKDWSDKALQTGVNFLESTKKAATDLTALNVGNFALKQAVNATTDQPVFNENLGTLAEQEGETLKSAPLFGLAGSVGDVSKLTPFSEYKNAAVEGLIKDPSADNIARTKQIISDHGAEQGWTPEEIKATQDHIDQIGQVVQSIPKGIAPDKKEKAIDLIINRNKLQSELSDVQQQNGQLDPAFAGAGDQGQLLSDKIDQANDKLRDLATGKRTTYSKGTEIDGEEGKFFKTVNGVKEEITPERYALEKLERESKAEGNANTSDNNAIKEENSLSLNKKDGEQNTNENNIPEGSQEESVINRETEADTNRTDQNGKEESSNVGDNTIGGNKEETGTDIKNEPIGKEETSKGQDNGLLANNDNGGLSIRASSSDGEKTGEKVIDEGTRSPSESQHIGQSRGESSNTDIVGTHDTTPKVENAGTEEKVQPKPEAPGGQMVNESRELSDLQGNNIEAHGKGNLQQVSEQGSISDIHQQGDNPEVKKTILTKRAYEGDIQPDVKKYLEDKGLTRQSFSQEERSKQATGFINKFGEEAAHMAVENGDIEGGMAASVLAQLQIRNTRAMAELPEGSDERDELAKKQAENIALMEKKGYLGGEFNGQLAHEYENAELDYANVKRNVEKLTGKPITEGQEKKIKEVTDQNESLKAKLAESEAKLIEETDKAFKAGEESAKNETATEKAKRIADKLRKNAKLSRPGVFSSASPASLLWDAAVEVTAKSIEAGGKLADAIDAGLKHIKESDWYKGLPQNKKDLAEKEFKNFGHNSSGSTDVADLQERFADKSHNKFSPDEAKSVWGYMRKTYIDNGVSYKDALSKTAEDLGLSWRQVSEAITTPKLKRASDEMWKRQSELARNRAGIKNWIDDQNKSAVGKALQKVSGYFRGVAVFGHGGIFVGTHAGPTLFNPSTWNKVIPAFLRGWKFAYGNEGDYARRIEQLKNSPNYLIAERAGLKNNPDRINVEEYQKSQKFLGKLSMAGEKGFNAIKVLRQDLFDYHFNKLTPAERDDPTVAKSIAQLVNLATGATDAKLPTIVNEATFAGGMEVARWQKLLQSPTKAANTALEAIMHPDKVSTSDKVFAKLWARRVGEQVATYSTLLAANAAIQNTINPKNKVNVTDPSKPDWLKFKFGDVTIDPTSGMRSTASFIYKLGKIPFENKAELHGDRGSKVAGKDIASYARGKLAPFYGTLADFYESQDFNGNTMPYSHAKPASYAHKLSWAEYGTSKLPLPVAEAFNVFYQSANEHGAHKKTMDNVLKGIFSGALSGTTGVRVGEYDANSRENKKKK